MGTDLLNKHPWGDPNQFPTAICKNWNACSFSCTCVPVSDAAAASSAHWESKQCLKDWQHAFVYFHEGLGAHFALASWHGHCQHCIWRCACQLRANVFWTGPEHWPRQFQGRCASNKFSKYVFQKQRVGVILFSAAGNRSWHLVVAQCGIMYWARCLANFHRGDRETLI